MGVFATIMVVCDMVSAIVAAVIWFNNGGGIITAPLIYVFFLRHFTEALIAAVLALQLSNKIPKKCALTLICIFSFISVFWAAKLHRV